MSMILIPSQLAGLVAVWKLLLQPSSDRDESTDRKTSVPSGLTDGSPWPPGQMNSVRNAGFCGLLMS